MGGRLSIRSATNMTSAAESMGGSSCTLTGSAARTPRPPCFKQGQVGWPQDEPASSDALRARSHVRVETGACRVNQSRRQGVRRGYARGQSAQPGEALRSVPLASARVGQPGWMPEAKTSAHLEPGSMLPWAECGRPIRAREAFRAIVGMAGCQTSKLS